MRLAYLIAQEECETSFKEIDY